MSPFIKGLILFDILDYSSLSSIVWVDELGPLLSLMVIRDSRDSICSSPVKYLMNVIYLLYF